MLADRRSPNTWTSGYAAVVASSVEDRSFYFSCSFLSVSLGRAVVPTLRPRIHSLNWCPNSGESVLRVTLSETFAIIALISFWIARETLRSLRPVIPREIWSRILVPSLSGNRSFLLTVLERETWHTSSHARAFSLPKYNKWNRVAMRHVVSLLRDDDRRGGEPTWKGASFA